MVLALFYSEPDSNGFVTLTSASGVNGAVVIPSVYNGNTVVAIGTNAFYNTSLTSVTIPNTVTTIGANAFYNTGLTSVTIPSSVTTIADSAFQICTSLTSVTIPNSVTTIGGLAFQGCSKLASATIPSSVTSIGISAFSGCVKLESVTFNTPSNVTSISNSTFSSCSMLTSVIIPSSVTTIGNFSFSSCSMLTSVIIPNTVTSIGYLAFERCSKLTSVTIPTSVTSIGVNAFNSCTLLTSVTFLNNENLPFMTSPLFSTTPTAYFDPNIKKYYNEQGNLVTFTNTEALNTYLTSFGFAADTKPTITFADVPNTQLYLYGTGDSDLYSDFYINEYHATTDIISLTGNFGGFPAGTTITYSIETPLGGFSIINNNVNYTASSGNYLSYDPSDPTLVGTNKKKITLKAIASYNNVQIAEASRVLNIIVTSIISSPSSIFNNDGFPIVDVNENSITNFYKATISPGKSLPAGGSNLTYFIEGTDAAKFICVNGTGQIKFNPAADYEKPTDANTDNIYVITAGIRDSSSNTAKITIHVTVINDVDITSSDTGIFGADSIGGTPVYTITHNASSFYANPVPTATYSLTDSAGGTDRTYFECNPNTGVITFNNSLITLKNTYTLYVLASFNAISKSIGKTVTLSLFNITNTATWSIAENNAAASYQITTDAPAGSTIVYSLPTVSNFFNIDSSSGQITLKNALDYEASGNPSSLTVQAKSIANNTTTTKNISINITNVSNEVVITTPKNIYVSANIQTNGLVYQLTATIDGVASTFIYTFQDDFVNVPFLWTGAEVITDGKLYFNQYSSTPQTNTVNIKAALTTNSNIFGTKEITVSRVGITNTATWSIAENNAAASYQITTNAPAGSTIVYSLPTVSNFFIIDSSSGIITLKNALDYEALGNPSSLTVKVDVTINGQIITATREIIIIVTNVVEKINITTPDYVYVSTNITTELVVQLQTSGNNDFPSISYAFNNPGVYNESYSFKREDLAWTIFEGKLYFNSSPSKFSYPISVAAYPSSASMLSSNAGTKVITVSRVGITNTATWSIAENNAAASYQITTNAPDGSAIVYSLPTVSNFFNINSSSGIITLKNALDYEALGNPSSLTVKVDVTINGQIITATKDITINVTNVVEAPTITSASTVSFQENASIITPVYTIVVSGSEAGVTYGISGSDKNLFNIVNNNVYFKESPNFELPRSTTNDNAYKIVVSATSTADQSTTTKDITINVTDKAEAPTITGFTSGDTKYLYSNRRQKINALLIGALNSENNVGNVTYSLANKISYIQGTSFNALNLVKINAGNTIVLARDAQSDDPSVIDFQLLATNTVNGTSLSTSYNMRLILFEITSTSTADIEENISNETIIYTINTGVAQNDLPEDCTLKYFFTTVETSLYNFDQNTGTVKLKNSPNYESRTSYAFSVYVQILKGGVMSNETNTLPVTINVTNVAETPTITGFTSGDNINYLYTANSEIDRSQIVIHQITAGNSVGTVSYSLSSVVPNVLYIDNLNRIKFSPGAVVTNDTINFILTATNTVNGRSLSTSYIMRLIRLLDITSDGTTNIDENVVAGTTVYTITTNANKVIQNKTVTYGLDYNVNDANFFNVDSTTGIIKIKNSPNFEVKSSYNISINATINITNDLVFYAYKNITFNIVNLADVPTITSANTIYFDKNITTTETVYTVKATRGTTSTGSLEYSIDAIYEDGSNFIVNNTTGVVKFSSSPTKELYIVKVIVKDSLTQDTASQVCYINVFKIVTSYDSYLVMENFNANNSYFQVDTTLAKSDITYSITSGNTNNTFSVTKLPQDSFCKIYFVNSPNFESPTSDAINGFYKINITATLPGSARTIPSDATLLPLQTTKEIIVNVSNVVEPPIIISPNNITISYNTNLETTVYTIQATLVEKTPSDNSITYSIQDNNDSDSFICQPSTGAIKFKNSISNGSNKLSYTIVVVANDFKNNISSTKSVTINIDRAIHSNICFPKGTPVKTDQGEIAIDKLDHKTNTIRGRKIVAVTQTLSDEQAIICFEKDSIKQNIPSQRTVISQNHKVFYNGEMIKAKHFAEHFENVKYMDYNGETLYNVLLEEHDKMIVNNLICETLHPNNPVAQVYRALNALPENKKPEFMRQVNKHFLENPRNSVLEIMV